MTHTGAWKSLPGNARNAKAPLPLLWAPMPPLGWQGRSKRGNLSKSQQILRLYVGVQAWETELDAQPHQSLAATPTELGSDMPE